MDMNEVVDITHDCEMTGLINDSTIDYTASPWKKRDNFLMHVIAVEENPSGNLLAFYDGPTIILDGRRHETTIDGNTYVLEAGYEPLEYRHFPLHKFPDYIKARKIRNATAHNGINFDLLAYKIYFGLEYTIGDDGKDTWGGKEVWHNDTLVKSKTINPDRFGGHGLDSLAKSAGTILKMDFRKHMHKDERFKHFAADMLYYNLFDVKANTSVDKYLNKELEGYDATGPIILEKCVADEITKQSHRGFHFNQELAKKNVEFLDAAMEERRLRVEPVLPPKKANKGQQKLFTPPKRQIKKDGNITSDLEKFIEKIGATKVQPEGSAWVTAIIFQGKEYPVPLEEGVSLVTEIPATIDDTTHIKEWLVSLGWNPSEYKERDLSVNQKKVKLTKEEYQAVAQKYIDQTLASPFCSDRCEFLDVREEDLEFHLMNKKLTRGVKVRTNPSFTKGQDKEMCPDLDRLSEQFPFAKDVIEYLTYKHRRNSILGGGLDWEEGEEAEKGYMAAVRSDGRIATPADTCGAATSRMKHREVANVPRNTSLFGEEMRGQFEADPDTCYQIGYDFASLEARIEAHYCFPYEKPTAEGARLYVESLLLEKPFDVHTMMANRIAEIIMAPFARGPAKNVKYGCTYGAQAAKVAKTIGSDLLTGEIVFDAFWEAAAPLKKLKDNLQKHWEKNGKKYIETIDGRRVPTRAAHAILNSLFQSAGVICAKRTIVVWARKMRENNLCVDFWTEDWKNKQWGHQMIAYHDEAQLEVTKGLVKFKWFKPSELGWTKFEDKDEQKAEDARCLEIVNAFRKKEREEKNLIWSEAHESPKGGWFVAYSKPGQLVVEAVEETTKFYGLKVPLSADYVVGKSWADCH